MVTQSAIEILKYLKSLCMEYAIEHIFKIMRTNIDIDDSLMEEAFSLSKVRTKKELVHLALQEFIKSKKKKDLFELSGKIKFHEDYDYKSLRGE